MQVVYITNTLLTKGVFSLLCDVKHKLHTILHVIHTITYTGQVPFGVGLVEGSRAPSWTGMYSEPGYPRARANHLNHPNQSLDINLIQGHQVRLDGQFV